MRIHETSGKRTFPDPWEHCYTFLVAGIMNAKYVNGMPLARQEREFARYDLDLSTKTMANWIINCADRYLKPLYQLMKEELLESRYIHCDESRIGTRRTGSERDDPELDVGISHG